MMTIAPPPTPTQTLRTASNLREEATASSQLIQLLPAGTALTVLESGARWSRVRTADGRGYVLGANIQAP